MSKTVFGLAKELKIDPETLIDLCKKLRIRNVTGIMSKLDDRSIQKVMKSSAIKELLKPAARDDWDSLERIYVLKEDAAGLVQHITTLSSAMDSVEDRVKLLKRAARVSIELLSDEDQALAAYEQILRESSDDVETAETLTSIYRSRELWERLVEVLEVRYNHVEVPSEELLFDLAQTYEQHLDQLPKAFRYLIRGLEVHTENPMWLEESERLVQLTNERSSAEEEDQGPSYEIKQLISTLNSLLERRQDLVEEAPLSEEGEPQDTTNQRIMWSLGHLYEEVLGDLDEAIRCYENYRISTGENRRVLSPLERLYEKQHQWTKLIDVMIVNLDRTDSVERQCALHAKIAAVYEQQLNDHDEAEVSYKRLLELSPTNFAAIRGLQRIAEHRDDQDQLAFYIDAELQLCSSAADLANLYYRLGEIKYHSEGEEAALEHLRDALAQEVLHEDSVRLLEHFLTGDLAAEAARLMEPFVRDRQEHELLSRVLEAKCREPEVKRTVERARPALPPVVPSAPTPPSVPRARFKVGERVSSKVGAVSFCERVIPAPPGGKSFLMMETQVTQALYEAVIGKNPSRFKGAQKPVENVSWEDGVKFANALSRKLGLTPAYEGIDKNARFHIGADGFRLRFEAEWEFAAKGGQSFRYAGSDNLSEVGWYYGGNSKGSTHDVAQLEPNGYDLYDMSGNVWELCVDDYYNPGLYRPGAGVRVSRGGSWDDSAGCCTVASRYGHLPYERDIILGLRLSRSLVNENG